MVDFQADFSHAAIVSRLLEIRTLLMDKKKRLVEASIHVSRPSN